MGEKVYAGRRAQWECDVYVRDGDGERLLAWGSSPTNGSLNGFDWGALTDGSGRLAFALLLDATGNHDLTVHLAPEFERKVIRHLPRARWQMPASAIRAWVARLDKADLDELADDMRRVREAELGQLAADAAH